MPKKPERAADGAVRIVWPPLPDRPFELTAMYKWVLDRDKSGRGTAQV
jgi:hypothetical protein